MASEVLPPPPPPAAAPEPATAPEPPWRALHPASLLVNLVPQAWRTLRGVWPLLLAVVVGGEGTGMPAAELLAAALFGGITLSRTAVHWATLRYRLRDGRLEIREGLLHRRERSIDPARIQNVELVRNLFHRATGLVELRIETAGDRSTEGLLSALAVGEAEALRRALERLAGRAGAPVAELRPIVECGAAELLAFGLSGRSAGTAAVVAALLMEGLGRLGGPEAVARAMQPRVFAAVVLLAFAGSPVFSGARAVLRHHRFRLLRGAGRLVAEGGLVTRRRVEVPLAKVQLVRVDEPLLRRLMGYGTVLVETAGLGVEDGRVRQAEAVVPMVERAALPRVLAVAAPAADVDPWAARLEPPHPRALWRGALRRLARAAAITALLVALAGRWGWLGLALVAAAPAAAWLDWRWQGWLVTERVVVARRGFRVRSTWVVARDKLQAVMVVQTPLMRLAGLARVLVRVAGTQVALPDLGADRALELFEALARRPAAGRAPAAR